MRLEPKLESTGEKEVGSDVVEYCATRISAWYVRILHERKFITTDRDKTKGSIPKIEGR